MTDRQNLDPTLIMYTAMYRTIYTKFKQQTQAHAQRTDREEGKRRWGGGAKKERGKEREAERETERGKGDKREGEETWGGGGGRENIGGKERREKTEREREGE